MFTAPASAPACKWSAGLQVKLQARKLPGSHTDIKGLGKLSVSNCLDDICHCSHVAYRQVTACMQYMVLVSVVQVHQALCMSAHAELYCTC